MIHKLYKLANYIKQEYLQENPLKLNLTHKDGDIVFIHFTLEKDSASPGYLKCEPEKYDAGKNASHYLFEKLDAPNSTPCFPTYRVNKAGNKSAREKVKGALKRIAKSLDGIPDLKELGAIILKEKAIEAFIVDTMDFRESFIISVKVNNKPPGKSPLMKATIKRRRKELYVPYYTYNRKEYRIKEKTCNLCRKQQAEVWGYVSTFPFYAVKTEMAPVAGGFDATDAWKNYPVCPDCAKKLDSCRDFAEKYLDYRFCGLPYYMIPEFIGPPGEEIGEIIDLFAGEKMGKLSLAGADRKLLSDNEEELFDLLAETGNYANYTLFFYEINNAEFKIHLSIDDVYPSRFKQIFDAKEKAENYRVNTFFTNLKGKDKNFDLEFKFNLIRRFFPENKIEGNFTSHFLSILRSIFMGKTVDFRFMLRRIMEKLRARFVNEENLYYDVLGAIMIFKFLYQLRLLNNISESTERMIEMENIYEDFFCKQPEFFYSNSIKAIFLTGVLCQKLLHIQHRERRACPFRSRLNGMKLNEKLIKRLQVEIQEKLEQYNKNYYHKLEAAISGYMLGSRFELSNDEISFYFLMGMNLAGQFQFSKEETDGEE